MPRMPNDCSNNIASKYRSRHSNINPWPSDAETASFTHSDAFLFLWLGGTCHKTVKVLVVRLYLTLCDPTDYSLPSFSVYGILQARTLDWVAIPSSRGPNPRIPKPRIKPRSPALQADSLLSEPPGKPKNTGVGSLSLLQGIFLTQESNQGLLHCRQIFFFF